MRLFMVLYISLHGASAAAQTACPTGADLAAGIRFTLASGERETFRSAGGAVVEALFEAADPPASRVLLGQGLYLLELIDVEDGQPQPGTRTTYSYPVKPPGMPLPQPGGSWAVTAAVFDIGELRSEQQAYAFGPATRVTFKACGYDMIPVAITYPGEDGQTRDLLHYLPALGLSYLAESSYDGTTDRYDYVAIEALH